MQKKTVRTLLLFLALFLIALVVLTAYALKDEPLNPMAEQALHYQPSPVPPEKNAHVGIAGLEAPAGSDFIQVGEENIRRANQKTPQSDAKSSPEKNPTQKLEFSIARYTYPCVTDITENCLEEIGADAQNIQKLLAENDELIKRYLHIQTMPMFSNGFTGEVLPSYVPVMNLSRLLSAKAVLDIQNGRLEEGLDFIEKDMNFYRGILASKDIGLVDTMIAAAHIRQHANLLMLIGEKRLSSSQMDRVRALLAPLNAPRETFTNALWRERVFVTQSLGKTVNASSKQLASLLTGKTQEATYFDQLKLMLFFKPNMSLNLLDDIFTLEADTINALAIDALPAQREVLWKNEIRPRVCTIPERYFYCRYWKNFVGEVGITISHPDSVRYLLRIHDVDARLRLFRAQLEFAKTAETAPETEAPEAILARLGPETFNPYTSQPFEWNPETKTLGFTPAAEKTPKKVSVRLFSR
jgi:hypothetical protein